VFIKVFVKKPLKLDYEPNKACARRNDKNRNLSISELKSSAAQNFSALPDAPTPLDYSGEQRLLLARRPACREGQ